MDEERIERALSSGPPDDPSYQLVVGRRLLEDARQLADDTGQPASLRTPRVRVLARPSPTTATWRLAGTLAAAVVLIAVAGSVVWLARPPGLMPPGGVASPSAGPTPTALATATPAFASPTPSAPAPRETPGAVPDIAGPYAVGGPWIVYQIPSVGGVDIGLVRPDGSEARQIPPAGEWQRWSPAWSPDGTRILYSRYVPATGDETVAVVNADGSDDRVLLGCDDPCRFTGAGWSPDGRSLIFYRIERRAEGEICLMGLHDLDTADETVITEHPDCSPWDSPSDLSPDGQRLLFQREASGPPSAALFLINIDGTDEQQLTEPGLGARARWSPDGAWIVFQGKENEPPSEAGVGIWRIRPDGSDLEQLTYPQGTAWDFYPRWLPDGSGIIFSRCISAAECAIRVIDPDGANDRLLFGELGGQTVHVGWQPPVP